ncbi:hypothetical protein Tco_0781857 [Tanacetum coccineum]
MMSKKMAELEDDFREFKAHTERRFCFPWTCVLGLTDTKKISDMEEEDLRHEDRTSEGMDEWQEFTFFFNWKSSSPVQSSRTSRQPRVPASKSNYHGYTQKPFQILHFLMIDLTSEPNKKTTGKKECRKRGLVVPLNMVRGSFGGLRIVASIERGKKRIRALFFFVWDEITNTEREKLQVKHGIPESREGTIMRQHLEDIGVLWCLRY